MKKDRDKDSATDAVAVDEILPEYDFRPSRPNKYASSYDEGSIVVVLDPDVAAVFPTAEAANEALRALAELIRKDPEAS